MASNQKEETLLQQIREYFVHFKSISIEFQDTFVAHVQLLSQYLKNFEEDRLKYVSIKTSRLENVLLLTKNAPGNKPLQLIFCYFWQTTGLLGAFICTLIYPLPISILFYWLNTLIKLTIPNSYSVLIIREIFLVGIRCSVVSYLLRYCLHFPSDTINWITYVGSIVVGILLEFFATSNSLNYFYILLYMIGVLISYYKNQQQREKDEEARQKQQEKLLIQQFKKIKNVPKVNAKLALTFLIVLFLFLWYLGKFYDQKNFGNTKEFFIVGMMPRSEQTSIFYFARASQYLSQTQTHLQMVTNYYGFGYILPGLHLKSFFLILQDCSFFSIFISYFALHLPSLLLLCVYIGFSDSFQTVVWRNISTTIQFISNGLILVTVWQMIKVEQCDQNIIVFTAVVILTIIKLYKLNEMVSALLGVVLVAARASALQFSKKISIEDFLCLSKSQQ